MSYNEPPPPPPPGYGAPQPPYGAQPAGTSQKAVWSLVTGVLSLFCCGLVFGIVAILLGRSAQEDIARTGQGGAGLAKAGFITGIIGLVLSLLGIVLLATGVIDLNLDASAG